MLSLDAFGRPVPDLPIGVTDYATAVRVHGDQIVAERHPGPALAGRSVEQVLDACQKAAAAKTLTADDRVLSTASWDTPDDVIDGLLSVLAVGGSLVYVANPDPTALSRRMRDREGHPAANHSATSLGVPWTSCRLERTCEPATAVPDRDPC